MTLHATDKIDEVIASMGWDLEPQEWANMRRLCEAAICGASNEAREALADAAAKGINLSFERGASGRVAIAEFSDDHPPLTAALTTDRESNLTAVIDLISRVTSLAE